MLKLMTLFLVLLVIYVFQKSNGAHLSLHHEVKTLACGQTSCGIVRCVEEARPSTISEISSLTLYKRVEGTGDRVTVAILSRQQPIVSRFLHGIKVDGTWTTQKAEATLYLVEMDDCRLAEFSCQVDFKDGLGQGRRSLSRVERLSTSKAVPSVDLPNNSPLSSEEAPRAGAMMSSRDGSMTALQLSSIIQQVQTSLTDRVQHLRDRMEDKSDAMDKSLIRLESRLSSPLRQGEHIDDHEYLPTVQSNNSRPTCEALEVLTQSIEHLRISVNSMSQENVTSVNSLLLMMSQLQDTVDDFLDLSNNRSSNVLETVLKAVTKEDLNSEKRNKTLDTPQRPSSCPRDNGGPAASAYQVFYPTKDGAPYLCATDGGWTVIQRRSTGRVDFYRDWASYKKGFGSLDDEFWLGNDKIHNLTSSAPHELMVKLEYEGKKVYAHYDLFSISGEDENYRLTVGGYTGNAGDSFAYHNNRDFSTFDRDNDDQQTINCAERLTGAWWYHSCHVSNLNGEWGASSSKGPTWHTLTSGNPVISSVMSVRRKAA